MTQDDKHLPGNIRRVGAKDRKTRLRNTGSLFRGDADDASLPEAAPSSDEPEAPKATVGLPEDETVPPIVLSSEEIEAIEQAAQEDVPPGLIPQILYTPVQERYPPIAEPALPDDDQPRPAPQVPQKRRRVGDWRHNVIAVFFLLATFGLCGYYAIIWQNPYSALNPLAPPTPFVVVSETPDTQALAAYNATQTAEAALPDVALVAIPTLDETPVTGQMPAFPPLDTPTAPAQLGVSFPFALADSGVIYIPNANDSGCNWASIAGLVTGMQGEPLNGYAIQIIDAEDPSRLDVRVFSGSALTIGEGGFELVLSGAPQTGRYTVQLFSTIGAPLSPEYDITTRDTCDENVAIVNFVQVAEM